MEKQLGVTQQNKHFKMSSTMNRKEVPVGMIKINSVNLKIVNQSSKYLY